MTYGFGIIGCGMISNFHAKAIGDIRGARVVGCFDAIPSAAERFAQTHGCRHYTQLKQMLAHLSALIGLTRSPPQTFTQVTLTWQKRCSGRSPATILLPGGRSHLILSQELYCVEEL